MILFIFEGKKLEPKIFETIKYLFFKKDCIHVSYCSNIFSLYQDMKKLDIFNTMETDYVDILTVLKNRKSKESDNKDTDLSGYDKDDFDEVYLFFDYDIQKLSKTNKKSLREQNEVIEQMLAYFNNETRHGKLYINYPMTESLRYFKKELPDENFYKYTSSVFLQRDFKKKVHCISFYKDMRFIAFDCNKNGKLKLPKNNKGSIDNSAIASIQSNWNFVKDLNIKKANYICCGINTFPTKKDDISQIKIFENQKAKYINKLCKKIAILNSFPLFLYDYFK